MSFVKTIIVDFDGTLTQYSGWQGADVCPDPPVPGAMDWLRAMFDHEHFEPQIYSARSSITGGVGAMRNWLLKHGDFTPEEVDQIKFPLTKPAAFLTVDDRAICFNGSFPTLEEMAAFKPWYQRG